MITKKKVIAKHAIRKITGTISFGTMIYSYRLSQEYNQTEMANILEISKQDLCNIEKGRKLVSVERAITFANALSMPIKTFAKYALQDQLYKAGQIGEVSIS
jgi:DNA-binding XRE family transcriptional regulator